MFDDRGRFIRSANLLWPTVVGIADGVAGVRAGVLHIPPVGDLSFPPEPVDYGMLELESGRVLWEEDGFQGKRTYSIASDGLTGIAPFPFDIDPSAAMGRDGLYVTFGENQGPQIRQYGTAGLRRIIRLAEPLARAPSTEDVHSEVEFYYEPYEMPDSTREWISEVRRRRHLGMPLPEIMPVFSRLLIDDAGWLWAELYRFDVLAPVRWLVFSPNGEGVGSVDMPPDLHLWQIGQDFVLGVWRDELRVEYVRRHALIGRG